MRLFLKDFKDFELLAVEVKLFQVILSCYGHEIKQPIKFLVLIRTTDLIGPLIW